MGASTQSGGGGVISLLGVAFVVLKLTGYIDWSWWYVTLPFWIGLPIMLLFVFAVLFYGIGKELWKNRKRQWR